MYEFKMPSLGAEMTHGKLLEWQVAPGDKVHRNDIIAIIDTDKAAIEVESFGEGTVDKLITVPGERVPVGTVMALIDESDEKTTPPPIESELASTLKVSPLARKLAHQLHIDLSKIKGTGPGGVIVEGDIKTCSASRVLQDDRMASIQKVIAKAMEKSKREIPHYYLSSKIDMSHALNWLEQYNRDHPVTERMLYAALLIKAVVQAVKKFSEFNGFYINHEYKASASIHVGMVTSLRGGGVINPALLDAEKLSLAEIMQHLTDLVSRARRGKLTSSELSSSTITITNLGESGVDTVLGVIYPPQVALLGFGGIASDKTIVATLSADHRVTNGLLGSRFLAAIKELLQEPGRL